MIQSPAELLSSDGPLSRVIPQFTPRKQQQEMATAIEKAIDDNNLLITEAGTGTGKTFAYLVPAIMSGKKIIISTGTKTLQEQLFHRDLPTVRKALAVPVTVAMLKGRSNYLCIHRLQQYQETLSISGPRRFGNDNVRRLQHIQQWAGITKTGDIAEQNEVTEDAPVWYQVTSTADNCLGQECPSWSQCYVVKARRSAQEADVIVINHHLLFADMLLKDEGFGELLPGANSFLIDEAHQLPEIASDFFGLFISGRQITELARDVTAEYLRELCDMPVLQETAQRLEKKVADFRLSLGVAERRSPWIAAAKDAGIADRLSALNETLDELCDVLDSVAERSRGADNCWRRSIELADRLSMFSKNDDEDKIAWFETTKRTFVLHSTPLDIGEAFNKCISRHTSAWIFTSATLAVNQSFKHFTDRLGLADYQTRYWESPFDYHRNTLLYIPKRMQQPNEDGYTENVVNAALPVIQASRGRAFVLFTSHRALKIAARLLTSMSLEYPVLVQGSMPKSELLDRFRDSGNAILLGTSSFWEGVDVRGAALSCVIIDKLPFSTPDDPVLQARTDLIRRRGGNPFMDHMLPQAVIALKQGVGRLIRDEHDRGVLMICDPRILGKSYGKTFIANLPPMTLTRDVNDVADFFAEENQEIVSA